MNLKINIIGLGRWGPNLVRAFADMTGVEVGSIYDLDATRAKSLQAKFPGIRLSTSLEEVLGDDSQAVVIATPVKSHADLVESALRKGKHVFVEKPFCATSADCHRLVKLADAQKLKIMVGHVFLFNPTIIKLKEIITSGHLGKIHYIESRRTNLGPVRPDVNAIWDLASHDFSIFCYLLDQFPLQVNASAFKALGGNVEDLAFTNLIFPDHVFAAAHVSWLSPAKIRQITVVGSERMLIWDDLELTKPIQIFDSNISLQRDAYSDSFTSHRLSYHRGDIVIPHIEGGEPLRSECEHFAQSILNNSDLRSDGRFSTKIVEILEATDASLQRGSVYITL